MHYNIDDLRCLLEVVRSGSMTRAAPRLGVSTAAVSRRVERLERDLGLHLLNRDARGVTPTVDAEALLSTAEPLLRELEEAVHTTLVGERELAGALRVTAPRAIVEDFLAEWMFDFVLEHPGLRLDLVAADAWIDLAKEAVDVAVRVGPLPDSEDTASRVGFVEYALVHDGSKGAEVRDALGRSGWSALARIPAVISSPYRSWRVRHGEEELVVDPLPAITVNSLRLAAPAVARGLGVGYLPVGVAAREALEVIPLQDFGLTPIKRPIFVVAPRGQFRRRKVQAVVEMIRARCSTEGAFVGLELR